MSYTAKLRIEVPAALYDVACAIARSLDPDAGGADSFGPREQGDPPTVPTSYSTETPCTPAFAEQAIVMLQDPAMLHAGQTLCRPRWQTAKPSARVRLSQSL